MLLRVPHCTSFRQLAGMVYHPLTRKWVLADDVAVNYIAYFHKQGGGIRRV